MTYKVLKYKDGRFGLISDERDELTQTDYPDLYPAVYTMEGLKEKYKYHDWIDDLDDYQLVSVKLVEGDQ